VSAVTDVQRHIRRMRACRVVIVLAAALNAFMLAVDITSGSLLALLSATAVVGCLLLLVKQTRLIGTMQRQKRELSRPRMTAEDYRHLREMETELGWEPSEVPATEAGLPAERTPPACQCGKSAGEHAREWDEQVIASQGIPPARAATAAISRECGCGPSGAACGPCWWRAAEHFAALARVGREHCTGFCPICQDFDRNAREAAAGAVQARLPAAIREATVATMEPGRPYWTVPWAMLADEDGRLWLRPGYTAWDRPGGTARMRMELREDGYHVWPVPGETYTPEALGSQQFMPVAVLEGER
jgi:hypothetical protein